MSDELQPKFNLMALPTRTPTRTKTPTRTRTPTGTQQPLPPVMCVRVGSPDYWYSNILRDNLGGVNLTRVSGVEPQIAGLVGGQGTCYRAGNTILKKVGSVWDIYDIQYSGAGPVGAKLLFRSNGSNINSLYTPTIGVSASLTQPTFTFNGPISSYVVQYGQLNVVTLGACSYIAPTQTPTPSRTRNIYTSPTPTSSPTYTPTVTQTKTRTPTVTRTSNFNPTTVISASGINASFVFRNSLGGLNQLIFTNGILTGSYPVG